MLGTNGAKSKRFRIFLIFFSKKASANVGTNGAKSKRLRIFFLRMFFSLRPQGSDQGV